MKKTIYIISTLALAGCIRNDIPYPIIEARINAFATENMQAPARINNTERTISITVGDSVDLSALCITKLGYTDNATLAIPEARYHNKEKFPQKSFESLDDLPVSADTRVNLSEPLLMRLTTYQDYEWTVTAQQVVERNIMVDGQVGNAVIDPVNRNVIIYVNKDTKINALHVSQFSLGGEHGNVIPDPTDQVIYKGGFDFKETNSFYVKHAWEETYSTWRVFVYTTDQVAETTVSVFPRTVSAALTVNGVQGDTGIEYSKAGTNNWYSVDNVIHTSRTATAEIKGLSPATTYNYRLDGGKQSGSFTTTDAPQLPNGKLDQWYQNGKLWTPCANGDDKYWDTGNKGATTIAESNSYPTTDTWNGTGYAACLESKFLVLKFAAGNLFTGNYVRTDGTNGVLDFGRPFEAFPTKLRFHYKYRGSTINRIGDDDLAHLKGTPDIGTVYIILADWDTPFNIRTRKSERSLLDIENDPHIIAYAAMETSETSTQYQEVILPISYRVTDRKPKYITVVASSSKYGDYFVGGDNSCLWVDDIELLYE